MTTKNEEYRLQVMRNILRKYVDRKAEVRTDKIVYTYYDFNTKVRSHMVMDMAEANRIFEELYCE